MKRGFLAVLLIACGNVYAQAYPGQIGQSNSATNGFSNAAVAGQSNVQINNSSNSVAKYGNGVECPQATLNVTPYAQQTNLGGATGQSTGLAVGVAIPLGDSGTCSRMASNLEHQQRTNDRYQQIKLCIELKRNKVSIDPYVDPDLYEICKGVHI